MPPFGSGPPFRPCRPFYRQVDESEIRLDSVSLKLNRSNTLRLPFEVSLIIPRAEIHRRWYQGGQLIQEEEYKLTGITLVHSPRYPHRPGLFGGGRPGRPPLPAPAPGPAPEPAPEPTPAPTSFPASAPPSAPGSAPAPWLPAPPGQRPAAAYGKPTGGGPAPPGKEAPAAVPLTWAFPSEEPASPAGPEAPGPAPPADPSLASPSVPLSPPPPPPSLPPPPSPPLPHRPPRINIFTRRGEGRKEEKK